LNAPRYRIVVCRGPECGDKRGSSALHGELVRLIRERGLAPRCELEWQSCFGRCQSGPNIMVRTITKEDQGPLRFTVLLPSASGDSVLYNGVRVEELPRILDDHVIGGRPVRALLARKKL
jgi:NADP-reducing hydrogenase subunit HndC